MSWHCVANSMVNWSLWIVVCECYYKSQVKMMGVMNEYVGQDNTGQGACSGLMMTVECVLKKN